MLNCDMHFVTFEYFKHFKEILNIFFCLTVFEIKLTYMNVYVHMKLHVCEAIF